MFPLECMIESFQDEDFMNGVLRKFYNLVVARKGGYGDSDEAKNRRLKNMELSLESKQNIITMRQDNEDTLNAIEKQTNQSIVDLKVDYISNRLKSKLVLTYNESKERIDDQSEHDEDAE